MHRHLLTAVRGLAAFIVGGAWAPAALAGQWSPVDGLPDWVELTPSGEAASVASAISALPIAAVAYGSAQLLSEGAQFVMVSVEVVGERMAWVIERASDHARMTLTLSGDLARGASVHAGTALGIVAIGSGRVLVSGGQAVCFIPNAFGATLLHHEELSK